MAVEMSKGRRVLCLIAIMLTNIAVMADLVIIPVISNLYMSFPEEIQIVNYMVSGRLPSIRLRPALLLWRKG